MERIHKKVICFGSYKFRLSLMRNFSFEKHCNLWFVFDYIKNNKHNGICILSQKDHDELVNLSHSLFKEKRIIEHDKFKSDYISLFTTPE